MSKLKPELPEQILQELEKRYLADRNLEGSWESEKPALERVLSEVVHEVAFNYDINGVLGVGGSGVVLSALDKNLNAKRALKLSRPSPGKEEMLAKILTKETESLKRLSHPNLIRIFAQGAITDGDRDYPFYVMDFVEGVKDADDYLRTDVDERSVIDLLRGVLEAVAYLHEQNKIHMDIKPGNILVTPAGVPIISDLGFAKDLKTEAGFTLIGGTQGFMHPDAYSFVHEASSDPNRMRGEALRERLNPIWDAFSLGKTFLRLLQELDNYNSKCLTAYTHRYLNLLSCRLLDGKNSDGELALGLSLATMKEIKYVTVDEALVDLQKLSGEYNLEARIPELNPFVEDTIQASHTAVTPFTPRVRALLADPAMTALGTVSQLGLLNLIYPTATHTRLEHSLGTFSVLVRYVAALYHDPLSPLFCQIMSEEDLRAVLVAGLVHDVGQYPLAHDLEEAHARVFSHGRRGSTILSDDNRSLARVIEDPEGWNVPVQRVIDILRARPRAMEGQLRDRILHSLIDGPIDADKIDYLVRDSENLGLEYGRGLSFERLLRTLTVVSREDRGQTYAGLGIHEKGKIPAEGVAFARYAMFGQVYWQHTYRSIKAKLQRMAWEMLERAADEDAIKKQGFEKNLRQQLNQFLDTSSVTPAQEELFKSGEAWPHAGQIQPADHAMLQWLSTHSGTVGQQLYHHLRYRKLFQRILVLSRSRGNGGIWQDVLQFYAHDRSHTSWAQKLELQRAFQEQVIHLVREATEPDIVSTVVTDDARTAFISEGEESIVVLVDLPVEQSRSEGSLEYIVEDDRRRAKGDDMKTGSLEESVVWHELRENFHQSIGKLRVFCHPDHAAFVSAYLGRQQLEAALRVALGKVES